MDEVISKEVLKLLKHYHQGENPGFCRVCEHKIKFQNMLKHFKIRHNDILGSAVREAEKTVSQELSEGLKNRFDLKDSPLKILKDANKIEASQNYTKRKTLYTGIHE